MSRPTPHLPLSMEHRWLSFAELARPANLPTAAADVLAGAAIVGGLSPALGWLVAASVLLYAGGVVLNDAFDAELDARERPERAIPSGRVARGEAFLFGSLLLLGGVSLATFAGAASAWTAFAIALLVVAYDGYLKHHAWLGPPGMGMCRALNLLLGMTLVPAALADMWLLTLLPLAHVTALTLFARGEVGGGRRTHASIALAVSAGVGTALVALAMQQQAPAAFAAALGMSTLYLLFTSTRYVAAWRRADASVVRRAVKTGVLALVLLDAALAAIFGGPVFAIVILALLPLSMVLARRFAVA